MEDVIRILCDLPNNYIYRGHANAGWGLESTLERLIGPRWGKDVADKFGEHEEMYKAELSHRYFKALKLAGGFAFIDGHGEITEDNLYHAIAMAEKPEFSQANQIFGEHPNGFESADLVIFCSSLLELQLGR